MYLYGFPKTRSNSDSKIEDEVYMTIVHVHSRRYRMSIRAYKLICTRERVYKYYGGEIETSRPHLLFGNSL
jgi:hypothetical protein